MFQRVFPFLFPLPSPALMQSARRAAVRSSFLMFDLFPSALQRPSQPLFALLRRSWHSRIRPWFFAQRTPLCVFPVCKRLRSALFVCDNFPFSWTSKPHKGSQPPLRAFPALPYPAADSFGIGFIAAIIPYTTMHHIFNHICIICQILILTSKTPLHQSAGAVSLGNTAQF